MSREIEKKIIGVRMRTFFIPSACLSISTLSPNSQNVVDLSHVASVLSSLSKMKDYGGVIFLLSLSIF